MALETTNSCELAPPSEVECTLGLLLIEDQPLLLKSLAEGFRQRGFRVWSAPDGVAALELYEQFSRRIDIVLSDVQMPLLDGPGTLAALRKAAAPVRFCFMTGDSRLATKQYLLDLGALRVFTKPLCSLDDLAAELRCLAQQLAVFSTAEPVVTEDDATFDSAAAETNLHEWPFSKLFQIMADLLSLLRQTLLQPFR